MVEMNKRDIPIPYMLRAIEMLGEIKKRKEFAIDILEIGCMRGEFSHDIFKERCFGCCDGHSSYLFAQTGWDVISVDINAAHVAIAEASCCLFKNIKFIIKDGLDFARELSGANPPQTIGLLYLDAWDLEIPDTAEKHLEFYKIIKAGLNKDCLILIDDTDLWYDRENREYVNDELCESGKGKLLVPELLRDGYEVVFKGRQTLLRLV